MKNSITVHSTEVQQKIITQCNVINPDDTSLSTDGLNVRAEALWDTGATCSAITTELVKKLKLKHIGDKIVDTANGQANVKLYKVKIILDNEIDINELTVVATQLPSTHLLIGMDVISKGDMALTNGNGHTTFSFQTPATRNIDFGKEQNVNDWII
jgi:predicted aspartyl protease